MNHHGAHSQITIRGLIVPSEWDDRGNVTSVSISTFNEHEYRVDKDRISKKLLSFMREGVEVSGFVREEDGIKRIKIKRFRTKDRVLS